MFEFIGKLNNFYLFRAVSSEDESEMSTVKAYLESELPSKLVERHTFAGSLILQIETYYTLN